MTANPYVGWQVEAQPGVPVRRTESGRFAIQVHVLNQRQGIALVDLVFTAEQIARMYHAVQQLIAEGPHAPTPPQISRRDTLDL